MFSKESARHADACRFCWMCRHICPVAGSTGNEGWTPRVRGLMISMIERGMPYDSEIAEAMYHCTLCDACANDCATGYKPSQFIREARTLAVVENIAPAEVVELIDRISVTKSIFGEHSENELDALAAALPEKAEVLLYAGQTARELKPDYALNVVELLKKSGTDFTMLKAEPESGAYLGELVGYVGEVQSAATELAARIAATGARTLVVLNPADAVVFRGEYSQWGLLKGIEVVTATAFFAGLIRDGRLKPQPCALKAALHEPVKLTRGLDEEEPFKALAAAAGIEETQLFLHGKMSRCVGTVPFELYAPEVVREMVAVRCDDALRLGCDTIVTASPDDCMIMDKYAPDGVRVMDIYDILNKTC